MRHVLVLNQFALPRTEGGGTRHIDLFSRVDGWQPLIVAGNRNHYSQEVYETHDERFALVRVPRQSGGAVPRLLSWIAFSVQALTLTVTRRKLDVVYGSSPHPLAPLVGLVAARLRRVPFILEVRDLWPESVVAAGRMRRGSAVHRFFVALEKFLARRAAAIVTVTEGWEDHFTALGVPTDHLVVIGNGCDVADFHTDRTRDELRREAGISGFTAVFAGAHGPKDGIDLILDAAVKLPHVNFLLVGDGPSKAAAVARVDRDDLANVRFHDPVAKSRLADLLHAADVGIHAVAPLTVFARGMSPNKLFDYMAAGLPVVSNASGALRRVITDEECGRLVEPGDLALGLASVAAASNRRRWEWARTARAIVVSRHSRESASRRLTGVLDAASSARS